MQNFDILVINLRRRPDRRNLITKRLMQEGEDITWRFVTATDGASLDLGIEAGNLVDSRTAACWTSHQKALKDFLSSNKPFALILEDDATPPPISYDSWGESAELDKYYGGSRYRRIADGFFHKHGAHLQN